ncbi:MAG: tetratricopeptide repeat protein [Smithella sp.]|jgi:Tfp pilus assembly protein PilF
MLNKIEISTQRQKLIIYIVLILATIAVFWQVNQFGFVYLDDQVYVTDNIHIHSGITREGFRWAFSTTYAEFWHPLTWLFLMLDYQLYGLNAGGYHLTNLILHIMSTLLLFLLFNRMTGAIWKSAFVAAFFALHPLHVESVAWIAERKDVLSAFFWMLTLCFYVYYTEKPVIKRYLLVLLCFVCGLMSKSMVVTLPVIMILLDFWPLRRFKSLKNKTNLVLWQLKEKLPFFILSAFFSIVTICAQPGAYIKGWPLPLESRIINALVSFVIYLEKTFMPKDLAVCYPFFGQFPDWLVLGISFLILIISVAVILKIKRRPYLFVGWLWYSITLLPVIGIIPVGNNSMADRYIYLPSIGIAIGLAWGIPSLFPRENIRKMILFPAGVALLAILSVLTWQQCGYWKNSIKLFSHALQITKDNSVAHNNLGLALFDEGKIEEAMYHYHEAIRLNPDNADFYNNRGIGYFGLDKPQSAIEDYNKAIILNPNHASAFYNRGVAYVKLGQYQRAFEDLNEAIRLKPDFADAYNYRAIIYLNQGNMENGCHDAQKACTLGNCKLLDAAKGRGTCF